MPDTFTVVDLEVSPCDRCGAWHRLLNPEGRVLMAWCDCPGDEEG